MVGIVLLTISGGSFSIWYGEKTTRLITTTVDEYMTALKAAGALERSLVMQKGYLTYFFQDGNTQWLTELDRFDTEFRDWLSRVERLPMKDSNREIVHQIKEDYDNLGFLRRQVIGHYKADRDQEGFKIHQGARTIFLHILELCQSYRQDYEDQINKTRTDIAGRAWTMTRIAIAGVTIGMLLSALLAFLLITQLLGPIHRLARETAQASWDIHNKNDLAQLKQGVRHLMEDVDHTRSELEASRSHLIQASKMASVGKLAASVAHSIRNPLTSVKMRLFSLERSLEMTEEQSEDMSVISSEIRHIDNVLRNFLEFSRRPRLKFQKISPSDVVDMAVDLIFPRLESHGTELVRERRERLPVIEADPDQLKEAFINLLVNASEALGQGGRIWVRENLEESHGQKTLNIEIQDNGPGIPEGLKEQIFQPFFSTKDNGTGLGLSIALKIIEEHGGKVEIETDRIGAVFFIHLPLKGAITWEKS